MREMFWNSFSPSTISCSLLTFITWW